MTQHALAEKCGFTFSYIGGLERANMNITLKTFDALGVDVHQLFSRPISGETTDTEQLIQDIATTLTKYDKQTIQMAKDVLDAMLKHIKS